MISWNHGCQPSFHTGTDAIFFKDKRLENEGAFPRSFSQYASLEQRTSGGIKYRFESLRMNWHQRKTFPIPLYVKNTKVVPHPRSFHKVGETHITYSKYSLCQYIGAFLTVRMNLHSCPKPLPHIISSLPLTCTSCRQLKASVARFRDSTNFNRD